MEVLFKVELAVRISWRSVSGSFRGVGMWVVMRRLGGGVGEM